MATRDIPQSQWLDFLDSLSRSMRGRPVGIQIADPELGYQIEMHHLPLVGVTSDPKAGGGARIEVAVGRTEVDHTTHSVFAPKAVRLRENEQGEPEVLEIESGGGGKTLVLLKPEAFGEPGPLATTD